MQSTRSRKAHLSQPVYHSILIFCANFVIVIVSKQQIIFDNNRYLFSYRMNNTFKFFSKEGPQKGDDMHVLMQSTNLMFKIDPVYLELLKCGECFCLSESATFEDFYEVICCNYTASLPLCFFLPSILSEIKLISALKAKLHTRALNCCSACHADTHV